MANNKVKFLKSAIENKAPSDLEYGEIALNYHDGNIFYKNSNDEISEFHRLDARLEQTDTVDMIYNDDGDLIEVIYVTGNKVQLNYDANFNLTHVDYYGVDGLTHLYTMTLKYDANENVIGSEWSAV